MLVVFLHIGKKGSLYFIVPVCNIGVNNRHQGKPKSVRKQYLCLLGMGPSEHGNMLLGNKKEGGVIKVLDRTQHEHHV